MPRVIDLNKGRKRRINEIRWKPIEIVSALLLLLTVTICTALFVPATVAAKVNCGGLTLRPDGAWADPFSCTATGFTPRVDEVTVSVAALPPAPFGVKIT